MDSKEALLHFQRLKDKSDNQAVQFEKLFHQRSNHRKDAELIEMAINAIKFKQYFDEMYGKGLEIEIWHLNGE